MVLMRSTMISLSLVALPAVASSAASSQRDPLLPLALEVHPGRPIVAVIAGQQVRLMVDGDVGARRIMNGSLAQKLALRGSGIQGAVRFGPIELIALSRSIATSINGLAPKKIRWHWFEHDVAPGADGLISPAVMPYAIVLFRLRAPDPKDTTQSLQFRGPGTFGFSGGDAELPVGDETISVGAAFDRRETIVSASAGALLARTHNGQFDGEIIQRPVRYGIIRPIRLMRFTTPVRVASLTISSVYVRLAEPGVSGFPENSRGDAITVDDNEIVVRGERSHRNPRLIMSIGSDDLARCGSIAYENNTHRLTMSCRD